MVSSQVIFQSLSQQYRVVLDKGGKAFVEFRSRSRWARLGQECAPGYEPEAACELVCGAVEDSQYFDSGSVAPAQTPLF